MNKSCKERPGALAFAGRIFLAVMALFPGQPVTQAAAQPAVQPAAAPQITTPHETGGDCAAPRLAVISPSGAMLEVEQTVNARAVREGEGLVHIASFLLPPDAELTRLEAVGRTVMRWYSQPQARSSVSRRQELEGERDRLTGELAAVRAEQSVWQVMPQNFSSGDTAQRVADIREHLPRLVQREAALEQRLKLLKAELQVLPPAQELGQRITLLMQASPTVNSAGDAHPVTLRYTYSLPGCGWRPVYGFDAHSGQRHAGEGSVSVRLMAEVWQNSGQDWTGAQIRLVTQGAGAREPRPLPVWQVQARLEKRARGEGAQAYKAARSSNLVGAAMGDASHADVKLDSQGAYAVWEPEVRGLPQGASRLMLREDVWQAPLQWLARPAVEGPCPVWLKAAYALPAGQVWPEGDALFSVDGQSVGRGHFRPIDGKAELFFGADPRVSLLVTADSQKRGESGFIDRRRVWSWAWTYRIRNGHGRPIEVTLERPAPRIEDADVTVRYEDRPEAVLDAGKHLLRWQLDVEPGAEAEVRHALSINAPRDMALDPVAP